ncbi:hypothetical protein, partial [Methylosinus sp. Sm6]|uniref:hypothetical protein n=1 Tax=Methylosinus sp. Sm6 TaxID=2866948 RepID=UPI001C993D5B
HIWAAYEEVVAVSHAGLLTLAPAIGNDYNSAAGAVVTTSIPPYSFEFEVRGSSQLFCGLTGTKPDVLACYEAYKSATSAGVRVNGGEPVTDSSFSGIAATQTGPVIVGGRYVAGALDPIHRLNGRLRSLIVSNTSPSPTIQSLIRRAQAALAGVTL